MDKTQTTREEQPLDGRAKALEDVLEDVKEDAEKAPEAYLEETIVPAGGE